MPRPIAVIVNVMTILINCVIYTYFEGKLFQKYVLDLVIKTSSIALKTKYIYIRAPILAGAICFECKSTIKLDLTT